MKQKNKSYKTLVVGCGIRQVKQIKENIVAIDTSQRYLDKAREIKPYNVYVKASVENLPFKSNSFKKVIFTHVLEHVDYPDKAISEIYRVLDHNGVLFLAVPSKEREDFLAKHNSVFKKFVVKGFHKTQFDMNKLKIFLKNFKGLNIKQIKGKDIAFWWLWGKWVSLFKLDKQFYIEDCGQIHSKKNDLLTRQFSRVLYLLSELIALFFFKSIISEYEVIATK